MQIKLLLLFPVIAVFCGHSGTIAKMTGNTIKAAALGCSTSYRYSCYEPVTKIRSCLILLVLFACLIEVKKKTSSENW